MIYTEKEAWDIHCCGGCAAHPDHSGTCTGSKCMAWRWYQAGTSKGAARGFCGLAGGIVVILNEEDLEKKEGGPKR